MGYSLQGKLLEVCSCGGLCPCWVGDDPDGGTCDTIVCWHYDKGHINDIDVAGLTFALVAHIPGNILKGNWKAVVHVDSKATPKQKEAMLAVHTGKLGGPLADLAPLIGEVLGVYDAPIEFRVVEGKGTIRIGTAAYAEMAPYVDAKGRPTKLVDTIFSTIPGAPAYVGKATRNKVSIPEHKMAWEFSGRNAILGEFSFEG
ncbi:MAG: DUF1326 domain-containing protein [Bacillati bacterium ANGP1]|uniref:DUF1326 domain-containing protein n=2 Tax=Candidatus Segetimicrobium genomatis TaxID=2569760 RepID=A0A537KBJ0_9BACT|nr:MAG: DUF1326 domain-containing protein [Terrabacteria group bacterium ANGP1]